MTLPTIKFYVNGGIIYEEGIACLEEYFSIDTSTVAADGYAYAPEENTQFTAMLGSGYKMSPASISFSRDGYVLKEWNTNSDGTGTSVAPGELVDRKQISSLYAIWSLPEVVYTVTNNELILIADAIRTKGNTSAQLQFPTGFVSAVEAISTGITPTGTKQISITENGTKTEDVTNYASAQITVAIPVYAGEIVVPTFYEVTVSLTNPRHAEDFGSVKIYEMSDSNTVGNSLGLIDSATGSTTIELNPSLYGLKIVFSAVYGPAYYRTSNISTMGDISLTSPSGSGSGLETKSPIFSVNSSGTITIDDIDWNF